ncbi:MAG: hypothetical protein A2021_05790 [Elusimicrobia bacterium GWF2_52_66]|nr:MAG: hypothetical protein A2X33_03820 [Elusimicrobia bacterium GWA2_51_34]OGR86692.1 MAG: hypothetical protein A2021_05790 [Elusimicrobia bacterium GWF2_52_66]HAF95425.1 hypothetical protein [Elusimicrobiota bacterium]HCE99058.1 hypothetical protein [Elusimicrobiota bacterium]
MINAEVRLKHIIRRILKMLALAAEKFMSIDGPQRAEAFSYNAFFSLFPLIVLFVTIASVFIDREMAGKFIIGYVERYVPISGDMNHYIFDTISGVVKARGQAGMIALLMLVLASTQFLTTLVHATNRAWGVEGGNWWRRPLKSLGLLCIMAAPVFVGIGVLVLGRMAKDFLPDRGFLLWGHNLIVFCLPWLTVFFSLSLFYRLAPRRRTRFSEVWGSALCAAILLQAAQNLFVIYLKNFSALNAVYGAFGAIMALLLWIYLSGCIFIFCACLCAAQAETRDQRRV